MKWLASKLSSTQTRLQQAPLEALLHVELHEAELRRRRVAHAALQLDLEARRPGPWEVGARVRRHEAPRRH